MATLSIPEESTVELLEKMAKEKGITYEELLKQLRDQGMPVDKECRCADDKHLGTPCAIYNDCMLCAEHPNTHSIMAKCPLPPAEVATKKLAEEKAQREKAIDEMVGQRLKRAEEIVFRKFSQPRMRWYDETSERKRCYKSCVPGQCFKGSDGKTTHYFTDTLDYHTLKAVQPLVAKIYDELKAAEEAEEKERNQPPSLEIDGSLEL